MTIQELITQQEAKVEALKKRIVALDQERNATVADILMAQGHLEGLQAALEAKPEEEENESATRTEPIS